MFLTGSNEKARSRLTRPIYNKPNLFIVANSISFESDFSLDSRLVPEDVDLLTSDPWSNEASLEVDQKIIAFDQGGCS